MATPAVVNPRPKLQRSSRAAVLAAACCGVFVSFASVVVYTFGVFLKPLASSFHWSRTQVSLAFTLAALTVAVCSPFIGRLLDRFPARRVVLPCTVVYAAAVGSLAFLTPHLWHLYAVFIVLVVAVSGNCSGSVALFICDERLECSLGSVVDRRRAAHRLYGLRWFSRLPGSLHWPANCPAVICWIVFALGASRPYWSPSAHLALSSFLLATPNGFRLRVPFWSE